MPEELNLRYELRAYESPNCCRLASFLLKLAGNPPKPVDRDEVVEHWSEAYPRHASATGNKSVRGRVSQSIGLLRTAGMAKPIEEQGPTIEILDHERLSMAAGNLAIVEDDEGVAVRPGLWTERPKVPEHLLEVQNILEQQRQQSIAAAE